MATSAHQEKAEPSVRPPERSSQARFDVREVGHVRSVRESVARVAGLPSCLNGQMVEFANGDRGMVMGFTEEEVQVLFFGAKTKIRTGDEVYNKGEPFTVPVGEAFLGRLVNSLGEPVDGHGPIDSTERYPVFGDAPEVMERIPVDQTLETGTQTLDAVIPIAKGQRQLLVGDRMTGKTTIALDAILNQRDTGVLCIYSCIGRSYAQLLKIVQLLQRERAMPYTIVVSGAASTSPGEQFLAPYTACTLGEYFMRHGRDVLVAFDDLTKHAWVYRQLSLLLERPPGREAYPGDIFYIHSQLVERAGYLNPKFGGGSMTFLPICDILQGDVTGYIPSNLISMTDGQIYLSAALFNRGIKPAIDFGLSVSRIGSKAQWPAMKELSGRLRLEYLQYQELLQMTQLRSTLSADAQARIKRGEAITALLVQHKHHPVSVELQVVQLYALRHGTLDDLSPAQIRQFKREFAPFLTQRHPELLAELRRTKVLSESMKQALDGCLTQYAQQAGASRAADGVEK